MFVRECVVLFLNDIYLEVGEMTTRKYFYIQHCMRPQALALPLNQLSCRTVAKWIYITEEPIRSILFLQG